MKLFSKDKVLCKNKYNYEYKIIFEKGKWYKCKVKELNYLEVFLDKPYVHIQERQSYFQQKEIHSWTFDCPDDIERKKYKAKYILDDAKKYFYTDEEIRKLKLEKLNK